MKISRREFIGLLGVYGFLTSFWLIEKKLPKTELVRPPGAVEETVFLGLCIRCGQCFDVCPTGALRPATMMDGLASVGTPKLSGYCKLDCQECMKICPTGALQKISVNEKDMGTAVIAEGSCWAWVRGGCLRCVPKCPVDAIFTVGGNPYVDEQKCWGCRQCSVVCPVSPAAVYVIPKGANRIRLLK